MPQVINQDKVVNNVLKKMLELNNNLARGYPLSIEEKQYYNKYLPLIKEYYEAYNKYWNLQQPLKLEK